MSVLWHLIKKDLRRLRWPLVLFSLLLVAEILFYASIAGLTRAPDINWLQRLFSGPEVLLRTLAEPLLAYFFVGWLVFEDSPLEKDAHWITRPISGGQLLAAKLSTAVLALILWPLALNILWWLACGCGAHELAISAREFVGFYGVIISLGLACAALTDGFPRFILWSFVGFVVFAIVHLVFNLSEGPASGLMVSRLLVGGFVSGAVALGIAAHQFITRRHRRSLMLAGAGVLLVGVSSGLWSWNFVGSGSEPASESPESTGVTLHPSGSVQLARKPGRYYYVRLPLKIDGLPDDALVTRMNVAGEWSFAGTRVWNSSADFTDATLRRDAIRRLLGLKAPAQPGNEVELPLSFSLPLAQRAAREPIAFHAQVVLGVLHGRLVAELPLRDVAAPAGARACTVSQVYHGPRKKNSATGPVVPPNAPMVVSLYVTERSAGGLLENTGFGPGPLQYALVNRRTGEFFLPDPVHSGRVSVTMLNQVKVASTLLVFPTGQIQLEDLTLAVGRFDHPESIQRNFNVNPVTVVQATP